MKILLFFIATTSLLQTPAQACVTKLVKHDKDIQSFWDTMTFKRKIDESCECGHFDPKAWKNPAWNVYIHVNDTKTNTKKTCTGTIINSNMIVTSHQCLVLDTKRVLLHDVLYIKREMMKNDKVMMDIAKPDCLRVTDSKVYGEHQKEFKVVDVIYNPQYARTSQLQIYPENDLVLIKVEENFLTLANYNPICTPDHDVEPLGNVTGFYYGYTSPDKEANDTGDTPRRHFGAIMEKQMCYEDLNIKGSAEMEQSSFTKTLCFKFEVLDRHSKIEGGPLIYNFNENGNVAFLFGVSTVIATVMHATGYEVSTGQENAYFSSIKPLVKFMEYFTTRGSTHLESVWCKSPKLKQMKEDFSKRVIFDDHMNKQWPWDIMNNTLRRDENPDCICGINNNQKKSSGRVVGGDEAVPREFGWMAQMTIYPNGKGKSGSLCGGAIINDRIILTAAHCIVLDHLIESGSRQVSVDPGSVVVQINVHNRKKDPQAIVKEVASVLFHPVYYYARRDRMCYDKDIALLVLKDTLQFAHGTEVGIRPVCLHRRTTPYENLVGQISTVAGWGKTDPNDDSSAANLLQKIDLPIIPLDDCRRIASSRITDNNICAGSLNRFKDAAAGDSGGPLMIKKDDHWYEIGVVSWGEDSYGSDTETAALYADVQKLMPFIDYHSFRVHAKWCKMEK